MSDGKGGYGKNKPYFPTKLHVEVLNYAKPDTPKDANGLFNGCPIPANCFVPRNLRHPAVVPAPDQLNTHRHARPYRSCPWGWRSGATPTAGIFVAHHHRATVDFWVRVVIPRPPS